MDASVTVVVLTRNEEARIGGIVTTLDRDHDVLVVDDGSSDDTALIAEAAGATVVSHEQPRGEAAMLETGFEHAESEVVVTIAGDGAYDPSDIASLLEPIEAGDADVVFGTRPTIPRLSERLLNWLVSRRLDVPDASTDLRAIRTSVLPDFDVGPRCGCGVIALDAEASGDRISTVPISYRERTGPQRLAWHHGRQLVAVLRRVFRSS